MKKQLFILIVIFALSILVGLLGYQESYITALSVGGMMPRSSATDTPLVVGKTVRAEFTASYDHLGIVKLRIVGYNRINTNTLTFHLREQGQTDWLVTNIYKSDRFPDGGMYQFGFPVIEHSKGKQYEIELTTPDGTEKNAIGIVSGNGNLQTNYLYPKSMLLHDKRLFLWFFLTKIRELFFSVPHLLYWSMFIIPVLAYCIRFPLLLLLYQVIIYGCIPVEMHSNLILFLGVCIGGISLIKEQWEWPFIVSVCAVVGAVIAKLAGYISVADRYSSVIYISLLAGVFILLVRQIKKQ